MANSVIEDLRDWQPDATGNDSNLPTSGSNAGAGQNQDLAGNLRLLKSEIRAESLIKSWERWTGLRNVANTADIVFTFLDSTHIVVNDNFTAEPRLVAFVGRKVRALLSGSVIFGTITAVAFAGGFTSMEVLWDSGALDATITEAQFGPDTRSVSIPSGLLLTNATGGALSKGQVVVYHTANPLSVQGEFVLASQRQMLVARYDVASATIGEFITHGVAAIIVNGAVTAGNYLIKDNSASAKDSGVAQGSGVEPPTGAFAVAMDTNAGGGFNLIAANLFGYTVSYAAVEADSNGFGTRHLDDVDPVLADMADGDLWYTHD